MAYDTAEIWGALKACGGRVYIAAEKLGCSPLTIKNHMKKNPDMAQYVQDQRTKLVDIAEEKFREAIENGEHWAIALALRTLGKDRGFVERHEVMAQNEVKLYTNETNPDEL